MSSTAPPALPSVHVDHNVYILGAGFSVARGLPMTLQFLNAIRDTYSDSGSLNSKEIDALVEVLRIRTRAASAASRVQLVEENIEDLFSYEFAKDVESIYRIPWALTATLAQKLEVPCSTKARFLTLPGATLPTLPAGWAADALGNVDVPLYTGVIAQLLGKLRQTPPALRNVSTILRQAA